MSPGPATIDRRLLVEASDSLNGIDFVEVGPDGLALYVHFLNRVEVEFVPDTPPVTITGGEVIASVPVLPINAASAWSADSQGRLVLELVVPGPGDFSTYLLTISSSTLDPFFSQASFTFQASALDCAAPSSGCPAPAEEQVSIDYLAKDWSSFCQALSEFSTLRYPAWVERSEADLGVVLMEALAAIADELSYYQDRVWAESTIETATQRLSLIRHARLVDYEPRAATAATTLLQLGVNRPPAPGTSWAIDTPLRLRALGADGSIVEFEVEDPQLGLAGSVNSARAPWATVDTRWNRLVPYYWDDSQRCLLAGASSLYVRGQGLGLYAGQQLLLDTPAPDSADPPTRELVSVASSEPITDPLLGVALTEIFLQTPTTADHDLYATSVAGNIVPAVHGYRQSETFTIPLPGTSSPAPVVVRVGANSTPTDPLPDYRYCLISAPLAWVAAAAQEEYSSIPVQPEIVLTESSPASAQWQFERWLLDAGPSDQTFTLTPEQYSPVLSNGGATWYDYDGDGGTTIRFGDGTFGSSPRPGTEFSVLYRVGGGSSANVPADTIVNVAPGQTQGSIVDTCTNPFPATGGQDAETSTQIRNRAPAQFSAELLRVVTVGDYEAAAQSLPWVQQAGTTFRWTGSWLTVMTSADPVDSEEPTVAELESLTALLDRQRLSGYESYVGPPRYVSIDLQIVVAGLPTAFASDVETAVLAAVAPGSLPNGTVGFFDHSRWGFGQALEPSALLAAIQACHGVQGVSQLQYREPGIEPNWIALNETLSFAPDQILRIDNDPSRPEAGSLFVTVQGSK